MKRCSPCIRMRMKIAMAEQTWLKSHQAVKIIQPKHSHQLTNQASPKGESADSMCATAVLHDMPALPCFGKLVSSSSYTSKADANALHAVHAKLVSAACTTREWW